jgi:hypothetical protein
VAERRLGDEFLKALMKDMLNLFHVPFQNTAQLLIAQAIDRWPYLWSNEHAAPQIVTPGGSTYSASRTGSGLIRVDTSTMSSSQLGRGSMMTIAGKVSKGDSWTRANITRGDPVAVLLERDLGPGSRSGGILLPARYGELFELYAPTGRYFLSAYAIDRYSASLQSNSSVRALGFQQLGKNKTIFGHEKIELIGRPSLENSLYRAPSSENATLLSVSVPSRERIRIAGHVGVPPTAMRTTRPVTMSRCEAAVSGGRCEGEATHGYVLCQPHLLATVGGSTVRSITTGKNFVARCNAQLTRGGQCTGEAVIADEGPPVRVYCYKHVDEIEGHPGRCRALTRAGNRCANPVMAHGKLCYSHNRASGTGTVRHYATSRVVYVRK